MRQLNLRVSFPLLLSGRPQLEKSYDRSNRRLVHGIIQLLAGLVALAGFLVAFVSNIDGGAKAEFAIGEDPTTAMHVWLGYLTLLGVLVQCVAGLFKVVLKARDAAATCAPWHGTAGPFIFLCGCVTACLGCSLWFSNSDGVTGQGIGLIVGIVATLLLGFLELCFFPGLSKEDMRERPDPSAGEYDAM